MKTLMILGERLLLGIEFLRYLTRFETVDEWNDAGQLPPSGDTAGFTADPHRLHDLLAKAVRIPSRYDWYAVDTYGMEAYYEARLQPLHAFIRSNVPLQSCRFDVLALIDAEGSEPGDPESVRDDGTLFDQAYACICRFLAALEGGTLAPSDLMALDGDGIHC